MGGREYIMKRTLWIILVFAIILAACLGIAALVERFVPEHAPASAQEEIVVIANVMDENAATTILFDETGVHVTGLGAEGTEEGVKIVYPGTYRISGTIADGQILVDCDQFHGGVYLMLDGADVTCSTGPAIYVKQSEKTVLYLVEGSVNTLRDGENYVLQESQSESTGGAVYCDDALFVEGSGTLYVIGANADGIRSKDGLTVTGGTVTVTAVDDGLQGSDFVDIQGGTITVTAGGDGITTRKGEVFLSDGSVTVVSAGDGISAMTDVYISGGSLAVTAYGGYENYDTMAVNGVSAKGLKGQNIYVSGGSMALNTADDGINADVAAHITGGVMNLCSGDDALSAGSTLAITGGTVTVETGYEGLEAPDILVADGVILIDADNDGIDALHSYCQTGGYVAVAAPQGLNTDGTFSVSGGWMLLSAKEEGCPLSFAEGEVTGGTLIVTGTGTTAEFTEDGMIPASFVYAFPSALAAGTPVSIYTAAGAELFSFATAQNTGMILVASGAMGLGQEYTLTAGSTSLTGVLAAESTIVR